MSILRYKITVWDSNSLQDYSRYPGGVRDSASNYLRQRSVSVFFAVRLCVCPSVRLSVCLCACVPCAGYRKRLRRGNRTDFFFTRRRLATCPGGSDSLFFMPTSPKKGRGCGRETSQKGASRYTGLVACDSMVAW